MQHLFWLFMILAHSCDFSSWGGREEAQCICWPDGEMAFQSHSSSTESSQDPSPCKLQDCWSGGKSRFVGRTSQLLDTDRKLEALQSLGWSDFLPVLFLFPFFFMGGEGVILSFNQMHFPIRERLSKLYLVWKAHPNPSCDCRVKHHCQHLNYRQRQLHNSLYRVHHF